MKCFKIEISGWTASFRYPNLISGYQPTLEVPPISTVLGLINAAAGKFVTYKNEKIGYYFEFDSTGIDLETIYQMDGNGRTTKNIAKSNIIRRQFLFNPRLVLYTSNITIASYFRKPVYPILLGRMNDLASVEKISEVELSPVKDSLEIKGQIIPTFPFRLAGQIQALPEYFTNTFPRKNLGTKPFSIISHKKGVKALSIAAFHDQELNLNIYMHRIDYSNG
jgi:CRISPR-associated protein Cas5t